LRRSKNAGGGHIPLAHLACPPSVQKAPGGARQLPPVHAVLSGQSAGPLHVAQLAPWQWWVMHSAGVHPGPVCTQNFEAVHIPLAQSGPAAQGAPPGRSQTPPLQVPSGQSPATTHALQTFPAQRWLPQVTLSKHGSPSASLQSPAWHTPLKQGTVAEHGSPKCPTVLASMQACPTSHVVLISQ
jgi:hypothetical protein